MTLPAAAGNEPFRHLRNRSGRRYRSAQPRGLFLGFPGIDRDEVSATPQADGHRIRRQLQQPSPILTMLAATAWRLR